MQLQDHDLRQLDADRLRQLGQRQPAALVELSVRLLDDLKAARERRNQNPDNSSVPPSSRAPWSRNPPPPATEAEPPPDPSPEDAAAPRLSSNTPESSPARRPGKQPGAPGHARNQMLAVTQTVDHYPDHGARCAAALPPEPSVCYTGYPVADVTFGQPDHPVLGVVSTEHRWDATTCPACGHVTRCEPYRGSPTAGDWAGVAIAEWRLIGPALAALLVWRHFRMSLSVRRCQECSGELLGLSLSVGAIAQAIHEAAHACAPVPQQIQQEMLSSALLHADETPHYQAGEFLWLWVIASAHAARFFIGRRTKELLRGRIGADFAGWLMADGDGAYREYRNRLRCWAQLLRKARALAETYTPHVQGYGVSLLETFDVLIDTVYQAREGPPQDLRPRLAVDLTRLRALCEKMRRSQHAKAAALGGEFLNDWDAIFQVLAHPHLPLTNNDAERLLRHWVIRRRIGYGTRTERGSLALTTFASLIETCRLRQASPLRYLHQVIAARRKGLEAPALPPVPLAA